MKALPLVGLVGLLAGCYPQYGGPGPVMAPMSPEPVTVAGPPSGAMDPDSGYVQPVENPQNPNMPGYPDGYPQGGVPQGYPQGSEYGSVSQEQDLAMLVAEVPKVGRNDPCPCGSGKKYKQCHGRLV